MARGKGLRAPTLRLRNVKKWNFARLAASLGRFLNWFPLKSSVSKNLKCARLPLRLQILLFCTKAADNLDAKHRHVTQQACQSMLSHAITAYQPQPVEQHA